MAERTKWFKAQCRKATIAAFHMAMEQGVEAFFRDLARPLRAKIQHREARLADDCWQCLPCRRQFPNKAALATHFFQKHGRIASFRYYAEGSVCGACGKDFFANHRLLVHLRDAPSCCNQLAMLGYRLMQPGPGFGSAAWHKDRSDNFILCPPQHNCNGCQSGNEQDRSWRDVPELSRAFHAICYDVLEVDRQCVDDTTAILAKTCEQFALFPVEFDKVFVRLLGDIHDLVELGEMPWGERTHDMISILESFHQGLPGTLFPEASCWLKNSQIRCEQWDSAYWRGLLPETHSSSHDCRLLIADCVRQGTIAELVVDKTLTV